VALFALQFAVAVGAHVYVTSSSPEKIEKAIALGAKGGVNYKDGNTHILDGSTYVIQYPFLNRQLHC
jgi:NADPH:quinone reductase-like Zn-dependent oxidoreductase